MNGIAQIDGHNDLPWVILEKSVGDVEHYDYRSRLKRVFAIDMERCPGCQQGTLRIIAVITQGSVIQKILRHLKLAVDPPPLAPAQQAAFVWGA
jgi:hypothetical protein